MAWCQLCADIPAFQSLSIIKSKRTFDRRQFSNSNCCQAYNVTDTVLCMLYTHDLQCVMFSWPKSKTWLTYFAVHNCFFYIRNNYMRCNIYVISTVYFYNTWTLYFAITTMTTLSIGSRKSRFVCTFVCSLLGPRQGTGMSHFLTYCLLSRSIARLVSRHTVTWSGPSSIPVHSMWDLWWRKCSGTGFRPST